MQVETIEKYVENKERKNSFITISFKDRNNITGKFIRQSDYEELKKKNLWRIVTDAHFNDWASTFNNDFVRIYNGTSFQKLSD
jgi:cytoplasmic iron level regulating protein YaaA (DUF328/UPF0246 family)